MNNLPYPEDLLVEIIHKFAEEAIRTDWLRLRLVNRFFNRHILFSIYVLDPEVVRYNRIPLPTAEDYGTYREWMSPRFRSLQRSWWVQGHFIKPETQKRDSYINERRPGQYVKDHRWWKQVVDESAYLITEYIDKTGSNIIDSLIFTGFLGSLGSTVSVRLWKTKELICDAIACLLTIEDLHTRFKYLQPMFLFEKGWKTRRSPPPERFKWSPCDILFLAACFAGDLDAVSYSLDLTGQIQRKSEDSTRLRFAGLYVAIRQDHTELVSIMLASGLEINDRNWFYVLYATAQTGNISMLQLFLRPEYAAQRDTTPLGIVLIHAAEYTNTTVRIEMCKLLLSYYDRMDSGSRTRILIAAVRSNDVEFAEWIIGTGPVNIYNDQIDTAHLKNHPMAIAVNHGSIEILRFLLRSQFEVLEDNDQRVKEYIFHHARDRGRLDDFMELVPYQTQLSREVMLDYAAGVDHALAPVDKLLSLADITPVKASLGATKLLDIWRIMQKAVAFQYVTNIEWLLKHGFRTETAIPFCLDFQPYRYGHKVKHLSAVYSELRRIEHLLKAYDNPEVEVICFARCTAPTKLSEFLQLRRPWDYNCTCDGIGRIRPPRPAVMPFGDTWWSVN